MLTIMIKGNLTPPRELEMLMSIKGPVHRPLNEKFFGPEVAEVKNRISQLGAL